MRFSQRKTDQLREISIEPNVNAYAEGSCLIKFGNTHVLCTASIEERVPHFLKGKNQGWITAEYNMLARSTHQRINRDALKPNGRNIEIQRLIGRSLRLAIDLEKIGERQITIDCDVLQADGGTRCASITGGYVALAIAVKKMLKNKIIKNDPLIDSIFAVSCGIVGKEVLIDLDYKEDSNCEIDANFVVNSKFNLVEVQATAEKEAMTFTQLTQMYQLVKQAANQIIQLQNSAIDGGI
jgi:ribonuclease PH